MRWLSKLGRLSRRLPAPAPPNGLIVIWTDGETEQRWNTLDPLTLLDEHGNPLPPAPSDSTPLEPPPS